MVDNDFRTMSTTLPIHRITGHDASMGLTRSNLKTRTVMWLCLLCMIGAAMWCSTFANLSGIVQDSKTDRLPSLALAYYQHHYQHMQALVNESSALVWDNRDEAIPFSRLYSFFSTDQNSTNTNDTSSANGVYHVPHDERFMQPHPSFFQHGPYIHRDNLCMVARAFEVYNNHSTSEDYTDGNTTMNSHISWPRRPHVLFTLLNENWGALSQEIVNKTTDWVKDVRASWKHCSEQRILKYLNHPDLKAVVTTQHQILSHPKVLSIPIGILYIRDVMQLLKVLLNHPPTLSNLNNTKQQMHSMDNNVTMQDQRPQLLMISSTESPSRTPVHNAVIRSFAEEGIQIQNTYGKKYAVYMNELRQSKFILTPSGMGLDCYRIWEAMIMGAIPVIEHLNRTETDGWFRTLQDLPVALIDSYDNLTPQWLEKEFRHLVSRSHSSYNFEKLTSTWWVNKIQSMLHG